MYIYMNIYIQIRAGPLPYFRFPGWDFRFTTDMPRTLRLSIAAMMSLPRNAINFRILVYWVIYNSG